MATPSEDSMRALIGHRFVGGTYRIAHWENVLFSDATGIDVLPDALAHPASLFHVAINGVGTSIEELFDLAQSDPAESSVSIGYYDWTLHRPLVEEVTYAVGGGIETFTRSTRPRSPTRDSFTYAIAIDDTVGESVADVEFQWHFWRRDSAAES